MPAAVDPAETARAAERRRAASALRQVLTTPSGRIWIAWQLRELCSVFEPSYVPGEQRGERHTDYNEGRRFVGLETLMMSGAKLDFLKQFEGAPLEPEASTSSPEAGDQTGGGATRRKRKSGGQDAGGRSAVGGSRQTPGEGGGER